MPQVTVDGIALEVASGTKLTLAIEQAGINIGHRCGGKAKCTTCRVEFVSGEPQEMTQAEHDKLVSKGFYGQARLSCQMTVEADMELRSVVTLENMEAWTDTGPALGAAIIPEPVFIEP